MPVYYVRNHICQLNEVPPMRSTNNEFLITRRVPSRLPLLASANIMPLISVSSLLAWAYEEQPVIKLILLQKGPKPSCKSPPRRLYYC